MDNSQSSDVLSIDIESYATLVHNTKLFLCNYTQNEVCNSTNSMHFTSLLEDCRLCVLQSLELVTDLVKDANIQYNKLHDYIEDVVSLLQMLSHFVKNIIESVSMTCRAMKTFPVCTGLIIMSVFTHCKDSESVYGNHLNRFENNLKNIFRACHELQLTYLMTLEKHYAFDLSEKEDQMVLTEALQINLKIGEIIQKLDVKTMAEQWKAYIAICEKYSHFLMDTNIYSDTAKILCEMAINNLRTAFEVNQEKTVTRSLKIASFTIKILFKFFNIFKYAKAKNQCHVVNLLIYIYLHNDAYLERVASKPKQFIDLIRVNVTTPLENFLKELLEDENFLNCVLQPDLETVRQGDNLLGYIVMMTSIMKASLQKNNNEHILMTLKSNLINQVLAFIPYSYIWFNMGLKFQRDEGCQSLGLYEYLLMHTFAVAVTLDSEQYNMLERNMYEALLSTDCCRSLFSSDLWILLSRISTQQLLSNQLIFLCNVYKKLENKKLFSKSPQQVHLSYTICRLFEIMPDEEKNNIYKKYNVYDDKNITLWSVIKIRNLPKDISVKTEDMIIGKLKTNFQIFSTANIENSKDLDNVINIMKLAATCSFSRDSDMVEEIITKAWAKACLKCNNLFIILNHIDQSMMWFFEYLEALITLTNSFNHLCDASIIKVLHVITNLIQIGNIELKLLLVNPLLRLYCQMQEDNKYLVDSFILETIKYLFRDDCLTQNKFFVMIKRYMYDKNLKCLIFNVLNQDSSLKDRSNYFIDNGELNIETELTIKGQLIESIDYKYIHKCIDKKRIIDSSDSQSTNDVEKPCSGNFDLADIDELFDTENESEPAYKKIKLNKDETEDIITRIDTDVTLLCHTKENLTNEHKDKIKGICERLKNIIT